MLKSIFVKCLLLLAVSTAIVAGTLSRLSDRTALSVADDGIRILAQDITSLTAASLQGAVRFNKTEDAQRIVDGLFQKEDGRVIEAVVVRADGSLVAGSSRTASEELRALADRTIRSGATQVAGDGFLVSTPVGTAPDGSGLAALAVNWSPAFFHDRIAQERNRQLTLTAGIFIATLIVAGLFLWRAVSVPLQRLARRTGAMADGNYGDEVPGNRRGDEIGDTARSLDELRQRLDAAVETTRNAMFQSAGFQASSAAMIMTDLDLRITHHNSAFRKLAEDNLDALKGIFPDFRTDALVGFSVDRMHRDAGHVRSVLARASFPTTSISGSAKGRSRS